MPTARPRSRPRSNPPSSAAAGAGGGSRLSAEAERARAAHKSVTDAAAIRIAQLHDEGDHIHCSEGNRVLLRQQGMDSLRVTLLAEIAEDDWMYEEDPLVSAAAAAAVSSSASSASSTTAGGWFASSAAGGNGPMGSAAGGTSGRGDAGGADRAAVTALYLERAAEQRASSLARAGRFSSRGAASGGR